MKKSISIILVAVLLSLALVACGGGNNTTTTTPPAGGGTSINANYYVDGASASAAPAKGNYVVYATIPADITRWAAWDYNAWAVKNADSAVTYSVYFFTVDKLFASAEELEAATDLTNGMKVGLSSYYAGLGRGAAIYEIVAEKPEHRGRLEIKATSNYASILPFEIGGEKIITVDQFGAYGDGKAGDDNKINRALEYPGATVIEFESAIYLQKDGITLSHGDVFVNGKGAEIQNDYRAVNNTDFMIAGEEDEYLHNVRLENLILNCTEETGEGALSHNADHNQLDVRFVDGLTIRYCSFLAPYYEGVTDRHVCSVGIRTCDNTLFEYNTMKNLCGATAYSGGLWFWGHLREDGTYTSSTNITIRNNHLEKASHDETFAFFMGDFHNVVIQNNYIYSHSEPEGEASAHAIGLGVHGIYSTMTNVDFSNNVIDVVACKDAIVMANIEGLKMYDNEITLTYNTKSQPIECGVIRVAEPLKTTQTGVEIYNNTIKAYNTKDIPLTFDLPSDASVHDNDYECIIK